MKYVIKSSYGNDSIALIQYALREKLDGVYVLYSDTGWGAEWWPERVEKAEAWVTALGFIPVRTQSIGMERLVQEHQAWPAGNMQFCTEELKIIPYQNWLQANDPKAELVCMCGVRREESARRRTWPEWIESSDKDLGRSAWAPLVRMLEAERNALIIEAGWEVLPHRSKECSPCIYSNKHDLRRLPERDIVKVEQIEGRMGFTGKGNARVLFRPAKHGGCVGIREVVRWADSTHGKFDTRQVTFCDSGFCGG